MRSFTLAVLAFATAVAAQANIPGLPPCAGTCVTSDFGGCGPLNITCICANKPLIDGLACCVSTACDAPQQSSVISFANALCGGNGVTDLPQSATCASGASTTSPASASGATTTGSSAAATTGPGSSSARSTGSAASSPTGSATTSATPASSTGSASRIEGAIFGVAALVFGALAAM
ncbi:CFEM domain-containing protein 2 [Elsinoe fawcettii]|nr:CFEM domain-containing protein 2 [Elsinoe fawcettii]